jgi:hypothetical protein
MILVEQKLAVARAQLGTATELFIRDRDPYSVHVLACGGGELVEGLAEQMKKSTFSSHILSVHPRMDTGKLRRLRNENWNAFKHFYSRDNKTPRNDEELISDFDDQVNDLYLFLGWYDYMLVKNQLPIEVQVFQVWWYATNPEKMDPNANLSSVSKIFPDILGAARGERKRRLKRVIEKYKHDSILLADPKTETGPLMSSGGYGSN